MAALFLNSRHLHIYRRAADGYLVRAVSMVTGSVIIDRPLVIYRIHGENCFVKHPEIMGLRPYVSKKLSDQDRMTWRMTVNHLIDNPELFVEKMPSSYHFAAVMQTLWNACEDKSFGDECRAHFSDLVSENAETLFQRMGGDAFAQLIAGVGIDLGRLRLPAEDKKTLDREVAQVLAGCQSDNDWCMRIPMWLRRPMAKLMCTLAKLFNSNTMHRYGTKLWNCRYLNEATSNH